MQSQKQFFQLMQLLTRGFGIQTPKDDVSLHHYIDLYWSILHFTNWTFSLRGELNVCVCIHISILFHANIVYIATCMLGFLGNLGWTNPFPTHPPASSLLCPGVQASDLKANRSKWKALKVSVGCKNWKKKEEEFLLFGWTIHIDQWQYNWRMCQEVFRDSQCFGALMFFPKPSDFDSKRVINTSGGDPWKSFSKHRHCHGAWRDVFAAARCGNLLWWFPPEARRVQCLQNKAPTRQQWTRKHQKGTRFQLSLGAWTLANNKWNGYTQIQNWQPQIVGSHDELKKISTKRKFKENTGFWDLESFDNPKHAFSAGIVDLDNSQLGLKMLWSRPQLDPLGFLDTDLHNPPHGDEFMESHQSFPMKFPDVFSRWCNQGTVVRAVVPHQRQSATLP